MYVALVDGCFVMLRDSTASTEAFLRFWDYLATERLDAYEKRRQELEAALGPGRQCHGQLVIWPDRNQMVLLDVHGPDYTPVDSSVAHWAVVVGVGQIETPSGMFYQLCPSGGAA